MSRPRHQSQGFVLILVLGAIAVMAALVVGLNLRCRGAVQTSAAWRDSQQALNNAYSGFYAALAHLSGPNTLSSQVWTLDLPQGQCRFEISSNNGKLNPNTLIDKQGHPNSERVEQWVRLIDILNREPGQPTYDYRIIPALLDWTDKDSKVTNLVTISSHPTGAERYTIAGISQPCPNRPVVNISELFWLPGMTDALFQRLQKDVAVGTAERVDLNQASETVLQALSKHVDPVLARVIVNGREVQPYQSMDELSRLPGMSPQAYADLARWGGVNLPTDRVKIKAEGTFNGKERDLEAQIQRNVSSRSVDVLLIKEI